MAKWLLHRLNDKWGWLGMRLEELCGWREGRSVCCSVDTAVLLLILAVAAADALVNRTNSQKSLALLKGVVN
ncbi:unnamed protein product [Cylicocyclus nassatus]|uniref:Uncharacterized protein n=1 Tax=Cylicocyclus nassatus TaxID=53992 RepID=A0AA36DWF6_CYLNA|nr:unnamed protein product [Cylicocyclus nassatus]